LRDMKTFTKLYKAMTVSNKWDVKKINIYKFQKEGTKRYFFSIEDEAGNRLTNTMFARLYDAKRLAYTKLQA